MKAWVIAAVWCLVSTITPQAQGQSYAQDEETRTILNHRLTVDLIRKTVAINTAMLQLIEKDPEFAKRADAKTRGIDESVKHLESQPEMAALLKQHGITGRDYLLTQMAMLSTMVTAEFIEQGKMPPLPADFPRHNLDFWKANREALAPLIAEWKKTMETLQKRPR